MADLIALLALGLQYSLIVFVINLWLRPRLPFAGVTISFLILEALASYFGVERNSPKQ
jgi:hypothetical protein